MNNSSCFWAKISNEQKNGGSFYWLSVRQHALDTMFVAVRLLDEYLSQQQRDSITNTFNDSILAHKIIMFLCSVHDVGKISPLFSIGSKLNEEQKNFVNSKLDSDMLTPALTSYSYERQVVRHCFSGAFFLDEWLKDVKNVDDDIADALCVLVNGHHGEWRNIGRMTRRELNKEVISGGDSWKQARYRFLDEMAYITGIEDADWEKIDDVAFDVVSQIVLTGLVIMSDWISSNTDFFPLLENGNVESVEEQECRIEQGFAELSLPLSYDFADIIDETNILESHFGIANGALNDMQKMVFDISKQISERGKSALMIIQEEMGKGKTEAALIAAENISRNRSKGVLFALPTQATTNAMLPRFISWMSSLSPSLGFAMQHSNIRANQSYEEIRHKSKIDDNTTELPNVNNWFEGSRKGILAPFTLCTVDQILMLALNSKFVALKHLGIGTKTIIIDEIHSCDLYMECFLNKALEWLAASNVSVIILSATLSKRQCTDMLKAYERGTGLLGSSLPPSACSELNEISYPSISVATADGIDTHRIIRTDAPKQYEIDMEPGWDDERVIAEAYKEIENGGILAIICNTVGKLQALYDVAAKRKPDDVELISLHSRYTSKDRSTIEAVLVDSLGKKRTIENGRPNKALIIGTQVMEQSLDIDVDRMFSYLAPIDAILQRAGREHRHPVHNDGRSNSHKIPKMSIIGYNIKDGKISLNKGSSIVYGELLLLRTLSALTNYDKQTIKVPDDVESLMDIVYSDVDIEPVGDPAEWEKMLAKAQEQYNKKRRTLELQANRFILNSPDNSGNLIKLINCEDVQQDTDYAGGVRAGLNTAQAILLLSDGNEIRFASGDEAYDVSTRIKWAPQDIFDNTVPLPPNVSGVYDKKDELTGERQDMLLERTSQEHIEQYHLENIAASSYAYGKKILVLPYDGALRIGKYLIEYGTQGLKVTKD